MDGESPTIFVLTEDGIVGPVQLLELKFAEVLLSIKMISCSQHYPVDLSVDLSGSLTSLRLVCSCSGGAAEHMFLSSCNNNIGGRAFTSCSSLVCKHNLYVVKLVAFRLGI